MENEKSSYALLTGDFDTGLGYLGSYVAVSFVNIRRGMGLPDVGIKEGAGRMALESQFDIFVVYASSFASRDSLSECWRQALRMRIFRRTS